MTNHRPCSQYARDSIWQDRPIKSYETINIRTRLKVCTEKWLALRQVQKTGLMVTVMLGLTFEGWRYEWARGASSTKRACDSIDVHCRRGKVRSRTGRAETKQQVKNLWRLEVRDNHCSEASLRMLLLNIVPHTEPGTGAEMPPLRKAQGAGLRWGRFSQPAVLSVLFGSSQKKPRVVLISAVLLV